MRKIKLSRRPKYTRAIRDNSGSCAPIFTKQDCEVAARQLAEDAFEDTEDSPYLTRSERIRQGIPLDD